MHEAVMLMELGGVILVLGILGRLAGRIGLSPIPFYLLAGLAVGQGGLIPLGASEDFISAGADHETATTLVSPRSGSTLSVRKVAAAVAWLVVVSCLVASFQPNVQRLVEKSVALIGRRTQFSQAPSVLVGSNSRAVASWLLDKTSTDASVNEAPIPRQVCPG